MPEILVGDVSLNVRVIGSGFPLVLMHGGPGVDHHTMFPLRPLSDHFKLIFYDHRCNGRSKGAQVETMTWQNLTADAEALRQSLNIDRWAVLGHSFGGMVAMEYALRYPNSLTHLILMDTGGDSWWVEQNAAKVLAERGYDDKTVAIAERFFTGNIKPDEFFGSVRRLASAYYHDLTPSQFLRDISVGVRMKTQPEALIYGYSRLLKGWKIMDRLGEIQVPTLVMAGEDDFQFPPDHQTILAESFSDARLEIIEGAGHNAHSERTSKVLEIIREFIAP